MSKQKKLISPTKAPAIQERERTREISPPLLARVEAAITNHPEFAILRTKLLEHGGVEIVPPCQWDPDLGEYAICRDPDLPALLDHGYLTAGPVVCRSRGMQPCHCHENIARLWLKKRKRDALTGLASGYCLSGGLWLHHSWGLRKDSLLETLGKRDRYFGIRLEGIDADVFAFKTLCQDKGTRPLFNVQFLLRVQAELQKEVASTAGPSQRVLAAHCPGPLIADSRFTRQCYDYRYFTLWYSSGF